MPLVYVKTFGCQANKSDSERILGDYTARGFRETHDWKKADEIVINSCSVRKSAEDRVLGLLNNIRKYFSPLQKPKIILTGCMLFRSKSDLKEMLPEVDEYLPINEVGFNSPAVRGDRENALVPISSGCNSFCTYCVVPYSRGREVSRPKQEVLDEIKKLAEDGYKSITLLGQNVNSYGLEKTGIALRKLYLQDNLSLHDLPSNESQYQRPKGTPPFVSLLREISKIAGIEKITFFTSNPWDFYDELIDEIATNKKIDRFIHLPVQSGSDRILKLMNRGYTRSAFLSLIQKIKSKVPDAIFGTDIIVGFPTETEQDFQDTLDLVNQVGFKLGFVARYSPRPGTVSAKIFSDDVTAQEKKKRWEILDKIINKDNLSERPFIP